jgi:glycine/D-amino acid oxidase-like deaminating enzyme/nitrite reductase/ring-hydroxylating ferredoxin subunit
VGLENIACDFRRLDGYLFQGRNVKESFLFEERDAARECGLLLDHVDATPFLKKRVPGLKFSGQAQFHPIKYLRGLLGVLKDLEVKVFEETHVSGLHNPSPEQTVVSTATGFQVRARHVVVATDSPINTRFHIHSKKFAYRTYAMAFRYSAPLEGNEVLLWDTEDPYHYVRFHEDQIIVGAEDHRTGQQPARDPFENLEKWTRGNFEHVGELCWKWSGQVFEPADQLPYIGVSPGSEKNIYVATGFSGIGLTHGTIASLLIPDLIEGKENPWAAHFDPSRPPLRSLSHFVLENMNVAYQYTDYISPAEVKDLDDIPEDTGCLMREGLTKACVYHEEGENFERRSAVCPHLGGIVHWNDIEKTWDCPAHGSRFNTRGKVIEGPSISGLADL